MPAIFTLLNTSTHYNTDYIRELCEKDNTQKYVFNNVMLKTIFGITDDKQVLNINDIAVVCDGRIYNHKEIMTDLNIVPKTNDDYEVIIYLYERFGIEYTLQVLDGIFSFVLVDSRILDDKNLDAKLYVARDKYGVKPLYILHGLGSDTIALSSRKQILHNIMENDLEANCIIEDILPGTYSFFYLKFKVLSSWEFEKFQIPYICNKSSTLSNKLEDILSRVYNKRFSYINTNNAYILLYHNGFNESPIKKIQDIEKRKENNTNYYTVFENMDAATINWREIANNISNKFPKSTVFLDEYILHEINSFSQKQENEIITQCQSKITIRYQHQTYFQNLYKKINEISETFYEFGLEIEISLLDIEFVEYYLSIDTST